ncbi:hypothetical protein [Anabaena sp. CCY 9402-a]|uniref:hypothetical protein n=1 Tax=Anabaena sp. CCY 9402-a TaxID=3103867 RepID=UPI0039C6292E
MSKISNSELGTLLLSEISYSAPAKRRATALSAAMPTGLYSTQHSALSTHYS